MNFEPYIKKYKELVRQVDLAFQKVQQEYDDCVRCKVGCADCCHALFDLTLIEAIYIKQQFDTKYPEEGREELIEKANKADRQVYQIKRQAHKDHQSGKTQEQILEELAAKRVRCPLLNSQDQCDLYEARPITCRLYGVPTVIGDQAHTCGLSGFEKGRSYPTAKLDAIQQKLYEISFQLSQEIKSRYPKIAEMLVPLSMALLTDYTEEYLGVNAARKQDKQEGV